jgi:hypothetical protein
MEQPTVLIFLHLLGSGTISWQTTFGLAVELELELGY